MKYLDEFSDPDLARKLVDEIKAATSQRWSIMEVCGGQTHSIIRHGIDQLLPDTIEMIHGPGCPVCVTPLEIIDKALEIAARPDVIFCSFGDMLRVPGSEKDLFQVKSQGGDVRVVYSPLDALKIAKENPAKQVVFSLAIFRHPAASTPPAHRRPGSYLNRSFSLPGTRNMSPNEQKITSGRPAISSALSMISSGVTQTGHPGPGPSRWCPGATGRCHVG